MKIRCTVCGAQNESASGFDTAYCLSCGNAFSVEDALSYRFQDGFLEYLSQDALVALAKEVYMAGKPALTFLEAAAPSGDVEINYWLGMHFFNEKDYVRAIPYLYVAAEKMYPDGQCLYAVAKYLQDPDNTTLYPRIHRYLAFAEDTGSKVFQQIDGTNLLKYIESVMDSEEKPQANPELAALSNVTI